MLVTVRLFAILRDRAGTADVTLDLPSVATVADVKRAVGDRFPDLRDLLTKTAVAVNQAYVPPNTPVGPADELALIPPVSGG